MSTEGVRRAERILRLSRFGFVGLTGIAINEAALAALVGGVHLPYLVAYLLATQFSTLWNFVWIETWAFRSMSPTNRGTSRFVSLLLVNNVANVLTAPLFLFLTVGLGINYLVSNMLTLGIIFLVRFLFAERIWTSGTALVAEAADGPASSATRSVRMSALRLGPARRQRGTA